MRPDALAVLTAERDWFRERVEHYRRMAEAFDTVIGFYDAKPSDPVSPKVEGPKVSSPSESPKHIVAPSHPIPQPGVQWPGEVYTDARKTVLRQMVAVDAPRQAILDRLNAMPGSRIASTGALHQQIKKMGLTKTVTDASVAPPNAEPKRDAAPTPEPADDPEPIWMPPEPVEVEKPTVLRVRSQEVVAWGTQAGVANPRNLFDVNKARLDRGLPVFQVMS